MRRASLVVFVFLLFLLVCVSVLVLAALNGTHPLAVELYFWSAIAIALGLFVGVVWSAITTS